MSDFLLELSQNPTAKKFIQNAGLPIPMPAPLSRFRAAHPEQPLSDLPVVVGGEGQMTDTLAHTIILAGADPYVVGDALAKQFAGPGEAYGRNPEQLGDDEMPTGMKAHALVFDATGLDTPASLVALYNFYHPRMRQIAKSGRLVVIGRPADQAKTPEQAAARMALDGFVRSAAKEVGKNGATANLLIVDEGAEERTPGALRFVLSRASAFVTGQPIRVSSAVTGAKTGANGGWTKTLTGKVALVTGAARGIGAATAEILAAEGAHVVCLDRPADDGPASQVARKVGGDVLLADVSEEGAAEHIAKTLQERHGGVDIVIHNAGVTRDKTLANMKPELWNMAIDINLDAVAKITDKLLDDGVINDNGRIVCLSSIAGIAGNNGQTNYSASKAGIIGYVQHLAPRVAQRGITVNAVAPGFIETRLTAAIPVAIREVARRLSALGQGGQPEDVGQALTFLSSPGCGGVTGQVLRVCGGAFVGR